MKLKEFLPLCDSNNLVEIQDIEGNQLDVYSPGDLLHKQELLERLVHGVGLDGSGETGRLIVRVLDEV